MARAWRNLYVFLMVAWFGVMVYYTFILTPTLTRAFPGDFGTIVATLFPGYFRLGEVLGLVAALAAWMEFRSQRRQPGGPDAPGAGWRLAAGLMALALVIVNREAVLPAAHAARGTAAFGPLHGISMAVNLATAALALFGGAGGLLAPAASRPGRIAGTNRR
ncbi:DUF4149 domain-containing protein [Thermaerobacter subterraneus]|uniref:TMEM205-like domain-containing protein n=1 Tax=Thermaerobacter subterraneus DSM 13965 TaxID=867903 RepID=K6P1W3_9FIRM|nr:DUF4149 domain-containing protein [Thermaerobacter subterraneus]EKP95035.1 hypothetical protein ThesuDRAFT_00761 [Thermaerobacter subterraneus DSM 13965]